MSEVENKTIRGLRAFAVLGRWRVLSGFILAVVAFDNSVSRAADAIA